MADYFGTLRPSVAQRRSLETSYVWLFLWLFALSCAFGGAWLAGTAIEVYGQSMMPAHPMWFEVFSTYSANLFILTAADLLIIFCFLVILCSLFSALVWLALRPWTASSFTMAQSWRLFVCSTLPLLLVVPGLLFDVAREVTFSILIAEAGFIWTANIFLLAFPLSRNAVRRKILWVANIIFVISVLIHIGVVANQSPPSLLRFEGKIGDTLWLTREDIRSVCRTPDCLDVSRENCYVTETGWRCEFSFLADISSGAASRFAELTENASSETSITYYYDSVPSSPLRISEELRGVETEKISIIGSAQGSTELQAWENSYKRMLLVQESLLKNTDKKTNQ